jgi:hypothetical protein
MSGVDITICSNVLCPKRMTCYRWVALPGLIQSYSKFPTCDEEHGYIYYIPATKTEIDAYKEREGIKDE